MKKQTKEFRIHGCYYCPFFRNRNINDKGWFFCKLLDIKLREFDTTIDPVESNYEPLNACEWAKENFYKSCPLLKQDIVIHAFSKEEAFYNNIKINLTRIGKKHKCDIEWSINGEDESELVIHIWGLGTLREDWGWGEARIKLNIEDMSFKKMDLYNNQFCVREAMNSVLRANLIKHQD